MKKVIVLIFACIACMMTKSQELHWQPVNEGLYSGSTTIVAVVQIDGVEQYTNQMEVAVFCGDECRGTAMTMEIPFNNRYEALINVYGEDNDELTFKAYSHADGTEYEPDPVVSVLFSDDGAGTLLSPMEINFTESTVIQTISLSAGSNNVSFYVDITLNDLKSALVEALPGTEITIKSHNESTKYNTRRWNGSLTWDLGKMYRIVVTSACEITLEGNKISPAEHPITIVNGTNWIAFPLDTQMTLLNAFAGFAVNGDMVKSQTGNAKYNGSRWNGAFPLVPGQGYKYISVGAEERVFTFPSSGN